MCMWPLLRSLCSATATLGLHVWIAWYVRCYSHAVQQRDCCALCSGATSQNSKQFLLLCFLIENCSHPKRCTCACGCFCARYARQLLRLAYWFGLRGMFGAICTLFCGVVAALCAAGQHSIIPNTSCCCVF